MRAYKSVVGCVVVCVMAIFAASARGQFFVANDIYTSNYGSRTIEHFTQAGAYAGSLTVSSSIGNDVRGTAAGPDGLMYATLSTATGYSVVAMNSAGVVQQTYSSTDFVGGNISFGKIAFGANNHFYVASLDGLRQFTIGSSNSTVVYTNNQVFDAQSLPSGDLLVLSAYDLQEITPSGTVVRDFNDGFVDARGVTYDSANNNIYVTMLGDSGAQFQLMRVSGQTGLIDKSVYYWYGDDLFLTNDNRLLVGSRTQNVGIFDLNLNQTGTLASGDQIFVTQMVPEPGGALLICAVATLSIRRRRSGSGA